MSHDGVAARLLLVQGLPMVVLDLIDGSGNELLFGRLVEHGLVVLPRFYGVDLPRGVRVGFQIDRSELQLVDETADPLLKVARSGVPDDWLEAALRIKGTMLLLGRDLEMDPDDDAKAICDLLDVCAQDGRVAGAIVGVAEQKAGLPLF